MAARESYIDAIEYAQEFQMVISNSSAVDHRHKLVESALELLAPESQQMAEERAKFLLDCTLAIGKIGVSESGRHRVFMLHDIAVEGNFDDISLASIGALGNGLVYSLCVRMSDVSILPDGDSLGYGTLLVPVLAVDQKFRTA